MLAPNALRPGTCLKRSSKRNSCTTAVPSAWVINASSFAIATRTVSAAAGAGAAAASGTGTAACAGAEASRGPASHASSAWASASAPSGSGAAPLPPCVASRRPRPSRVACSVSASSRDGASCCRFSAASTRSSDWHTRSTSGRFTERAAPFRLCASRNSVSTWPGTSAAGAGRSSAASSADIAARCSCASTLKVASSRLRKVSSSMAMLVLPASIRPGTVPPCP